MSRSQKRNILVVASDHSHRVKLRGLLERLGHFVVSTANGSEASEMLSRMTKPNLIILSSDLALMPVEEVLATVQTTEQFREIPVIQLLEPGETPLEGICHVLQSPVQTEELEEAIEICNDRDISQGAQRRFHRG